MAIAANGSQIPLPRAEGSTQAPTPESVSEAPSLSVRLVTEIEELERLSEPWRELAHACACPAALPGWQLAWWHHLAPVGARLRTVAVFERERLVGLAPFFANPGRRVDYRLLGAGTTVAAAG